MFPANDLWMFSNDFAIQNKIKIAWWICSGTLTVKSITFKAT